MPDNGKSELWLHEYCESKELSEKQENCKQLTIIVPTMELVENNDWIKGPRKRRSSRGQSRTSRLVIE